MCFKSSSWKLLPRTIPCTARVATTAAAGARNAGRVALASLTREPLPAEDEGCGSGLGFQQKMHIRQLYSKDVPHRRIVGVAEYHLCARRIRTPSVRNSHGAARHNLLPLPRG